VAPKRPPGATDDTVVLGMVAKFVAQKGHPVFVDLARRLVDAAGGTDLRFVIVGGQVPGHETFAADVRNRIEQAGLSERFWLVGRQLDVAGYIAGMDVLCHLPLCEDSFPGVPMEAAALGRCVLAFRSGGIPEELTPPAACRLVPIGDIDALTAEATALIADRACREAMGRAAREEVLGKFSHARHLREVDALYAALAGGAG
jgi:glycosyltransferase involved in cell wall biosynthesis